MAGGMKGLDQGPGSDVVLDVESLLQCPPPPRLGNCTLYAYLILLGPSTRFNAVKKIQLNDCTLWIAFLDTLGTSRMEQRPQVTSRQTGMRGGPLQDKHISDHICGPNMRTCMEPVMVWQYRMTVPLTCREACQRLRACDTLLPRNVKHVDMHA